MSRTCSRPRSQRPIPRWPTSSSASSRASATRSSSLPRKTSSAKPSSKRRGRSLPTNMRKDCRGGAITAVANMSTSLKTWPLNGLRGFSDVNSQTFSRTRAPLPMPPPSWRWFKPVPYGVRRDDHRIDVEEVAKRARAHRPKVIIAGGSAYPRFIDFRRFREIADEVGAKLLVDMAHFAGLVAGGAHPSPFPYAHVVTSTAHKTLRGPRSGFVLTNDEELAKKLNAAVFPGLQGGPLMHVVAAKAVAFGEALRPAFKLYARNVVANAKALAETLKSKGLD